MMMTRRMMSKLVPGGRKTLSRKRGDEQQRDQRHAADELDEADARAT